MIKGDIGNTIKHDNIYNKADDLSIIKKKSKNLEFLHQYGIIMPKE
jgi:hypothetical protein